MKGFHWLIYWGIFIGSSTSSTHSSSSSKPSVVKSINPVKSVYKSVYSAVVAMIGLSSSFLGVVSFTMSMPLFSETSITYRVVTKATLCVHTQQSEKRFGKMWKRTKMDDISEEHILLFYSAQLYREAECIRFNAQDKFKVVW